MFVLILPLTSGTLNSLCLKCSGELKNLGLQRSVQILHPSISRVVPFACKQGLNDCSPSTWQSICRQNWPSLELIWLIFGAIRLQTALPGHLPWNGFRAILMFAQWYPYACYWWSLWFMTDDNCENDYELLIWLWRWPTFCNVSDCNECKLALKNVGVFPKLGMQSGCPPWNSIPQTWNAVRVSSMK